jgi:2-polyprenyl-6-methoxyphenol hydroxylase-like FAD-dependent oxidoreductase
MGGSVALRAVAAGGGIGGTAAAVALVQAEIDVQVYEQAQQLAACASSAEVPQALIAYEGLRRDRTARVQLGSRRSGAGYDSSGSQLVDRRWIYNYDARAEAAALVSTTKSTS